MSESTGSARDTGVGEVSLPGLPSPSASGLLPLTESSKATGAPPITVAACARTALSNVSAWPAV
ncbi:hypothetical protein FQZ97_1154620 [compost metagenome]